MTPTKPPSFIDHPRDIGKRLRAFRKERKITARDLAASAELSAAYISAVENGHKALTLHNAERLAKILDVEVRDFGPTTSDISPRTELEPSTRITSDNVAVFQYNSADIRTIDLAGRRWAVAADICAVLGLDQVSRAVSRLESGDVLTIRRSEGGTSITPFWKQVDPRVNELSLVSEDGATDLVLDSRKPEARTFRRWLTHEVFPSIRDTGAYIHGAKDELDVLKGTIEALIATRRTAQEAKALAENTAHRLDAIEGHHGWWAALGYIKMKNLELNVNQLQSLGQYAASIGRENGIKPGKVEHYHFGTVNSFPEWVWDAALEKLL